ncbi:MAG: hypothetical protein GXO32_05315 [Crenarchaeota archaeon]|nr:hypothetical protein [Thermoproteota archaeon]
MVYTLKRIIAIAMMISKRGLRAWYSYVASALLNLWLMSILMLYGIYSIAKHVLVGAMLYTLFSSCMVSVVYDAYYAAIKLKELFLASPLSRIEFLLGISLGHMFAAAIMCLPYIAVLTYLSPTPMILPTYIFISISSWIIATSIGYLIPSKDPFTVGPKANLIASMMVLLPPVYYPESLVPQPIRPWLVVIPTYSIAKIAKVALGIETGNSLILIVCSVTLIIEACILLGLAMICERRYSI